MSLLRMKGLMARSVRFGVQLRGSIPDSGFIAKKFCGAAINIANNVHDQTLVHDTRRLLDPDCEDQDTGLVILNNKNAISLDMIDGSLFGRSRTVVCADGGSNVLFDMTPREQRQAQAPAAIIGDLDSVREDVLSFYRDECDTQVVLDSDQDCHDLDKCLRYLHARRHARAVVVGAFGGRLDHQMACVNALYRWQDMFTDGLVLISTSNLAILLTPGVHTILVHPTMEGPTCALLPIGGPCRSVTTSGLRWNLNNRSLSFGGLVSSSNAMTSGRVEVECSDAIIWMTEIRMKHKSRM